MVKRTHPGRLRRIVADNVRRLRTERSLSQQALALEIQIDRTYLGGVERGERNLSIDNVERIADGLAVAPWELLKDSSTSRGST